jgi:hypothetical protein
MRVSVQVCIKGAECEVLGAVVKQRNLAAVRKHCPPKNYQSLFANRHSLSHQSLIASHYLPFTIRYSPFAAVSARQEPRPPIFSRPSSHAPRPVETRSMNDFKLRH